VAKAGRGISRKASIDAAVFGLWESGKAVEPSPVAGAKRSGAGLPSSIEQALRVWRRAEARRRGVPAFRILNDRALRTMASTRPGTAHELLAVPGIGSNAVERYGAQIYGVLSESGG
jgi:DNA topoisomerase III